MPDRMTPEELLESEDHLCNDPACQCSGNKPLVAEIRALQQDKAAITREREESDRIIARLTLDKAALVEALTNATNEFVPDGWKPAYRAVLEEVSK